MSRTTIDELLAASRRDLVRLEPPDALDAMRRGGCLIDIRSDTQVARDGTIDGAMLIPRNVLEWRLDPESSARHPDAPGLGGRPILICDEGYASSLAAATLVVLGFAHATDVIGGFQAWRASGCPIREPAG